MPLPPLLVPAAPRHVRCPRCGGSTRYRDDELNSRRHLNQPDRPVEYFVFCKGSVRGRACNRMLPVERLYAQSLAADEIRSEPQMAPVVVPVGESIERGEPR